MRPLAGLAGFVAVVGVTVAVFGTGPAEAATGDRFVDDDGVPAERALEWLAERGVIDGCDPPENRSVCPDRILNRAEAAKILVLLGRSEGVLDLSRPGTVDHFADDGDMWRGGAEPFIDHLADLGIVHGCDPPDNRSFCPADRLLRGEITKMVVRTFGLEAPPGYRDPWADTGGRFFEAAARAAAFHGLVDASDGRFDGHEAVTRAEFAQMVVRVFAPELCALDPFTAGRSSALEASHPGVDVTAYAFDLRSGCAYAMHPDHRQPEASVFKVMVLGGVLLEAQDEGRAPTSGELSLLRPMITESANEPVRDLWRSFGGAPWFAEQADRFDLDETAVVGDYSPVWGRTTTSAHDQADLLRQVLLGHFGPLEEPGREIAFDLMTSVVPSQTWGITEGVPAGWTVAQKNGFAGQTANSVGVVYDDGTEPVYVAVILTHGWERWEDGVPVVERVGGWVSSGLLAPNE